MKEQKKAMPVRMMSLLLCFIVLVTMLFPIKVFAEEDSESKVVRVGYVNAENYEEGGEGEYKRGFGYEYFQEIASITGWEYEYVHGSFAECYEMLVNGEIDLFGNVSYKAERAELMYFCKRQINTVFQEYL